MSGEKTEQPTQQKLRDARKKGQVAISKDIVHVFSLGIAFFLLFTDILHIMDRVHALFSMPFSYLADAKSLNPKEHLIWVMTELAWLSMPLLFLVFISGYIGVFVQVGAHLNSEAAGFSLKRFDVLGTIKNMFSKKSLLQLFIALVKIFILGFVCLICIKDALPSMVLLPSTSLSASLGLLVNLLSMIATYSLCLFFLMAILDYVVIKTQHIKSLMMSKQEVFQEYKNNEGDPHVKSQRKQLGRELVEQSPEETVQGSAAVVVNPTHIAVCLAFNPDEHPLPYILAVRDGPEAQNYIRIARLQGVPIVRHVSFARAIYKVGLERCYIPSTQLKAAALIIRSVNEWLVQDVDVRKKNAQWNLD